MKPEITSIDNKLIKSAKKLLQDKKYRDVTNLFMAETHKVVQTLIQNGIKPRNIIVSQNSKYISGYAKDPNITVVSTSVYEYLSELKNGDGVMAVMNKKNNELVIAENKKYIILNKIQNPGNLGTIIRSAIGFGIDGIFVTNDSVDLYHPNIIRNSMGNCLSIPVYVSTSFFDVIEKLKKKNIKCYATANKSNSKELSDITFSDGVAVAFGNEGSGLNDKEISSCDDLIKISMKNSVDSLNVAVASGIVMYKISK